LNPFPSSGGNPRLGLGLAAGESQTLRLLGTVASKIQAYTQVGRSRQGSQTFTRTVQTVRLRANPNAPRSMDPLKVGSTALLKNYRETRTAPSA
ncbi:MAG: hypothetical protein VX420_03760, partial [SAR324 cluster bacterium]|nr:hypothetical protein [SAR324 cluster bacterium]